MSKVQRIIKAGMGIALVLGVGYCSYNFSTAETRVKALCPQIQPGMSLRDLQAFAKQHGLGPSQPHESINYLVETKSLGRHGCKVIVKSGLVQESVYTHAD